MKIKDIPKEELETMSYDEIAELVLQDYGKKMKLKDLYTKVSKALGLEDHESLEHITDFFELLSTNKKFIMLKNGYWDLQQRHELELTIEDTEEDVSTDDEEIVEEEIKEEENIFYESDETDDVEEDDLKDLVVVDEDEETSM